MIRDHVRPPKGHQHQIEHIMGALNWKAFFKALGIDVHGHTRTSRMRDAGVDALHCFRFVRSEHLGRPCGWEFPELSQATKGEHPRDVMLLAKMHIASTKLEEQLVFCHHESFQRLADRPVVAPLVPVDARTASEYEKTAQAVAKQPWGLHRAAQYLRGLIGPLPDPAPPSVDWLWQPGPLDAPTWPTSVGPSDLRGLGEAKTPGRLEVHDLFAEDVAKKRRRTECPPPPQAGPADASSGDPAGPPPPAVAALAVAEPPPRPPAPTPKATAAKAKPAAAPKAKPAAKAKAKASAGPPLCEGLGCGKCRFSVNGCRQCKKRLGWLEVAPGKWEHRA